MCAACQSQPAVVVLRGAPLCAADAAALTTQIESRGEHR